MAILFGSGFVLDDDADTDAADGLGSADSGLTAGIDDEELAELAMLNRSR